MHNYTYINNYMNLFGGKTRHSLQAQKNISTLVENVIGVPQGGCKKRVNVNVDALLASKKRVNVNVDALFGRGSCD